MEDIAPLSFGLPLRSSWASVRGCAFSLGSPCRGKISGDTGPLADMYAV